MTSREEEPELETAEADAVLAEWLTISEQIAAAIDPKV